MSKQLSLLMTIVLSILGCVINFYCTNLLMNSVSNYDTPTGIIGFTSSLPALLVAVVFEIGVFFAIRSYIFKENFKRMVKGYGIAFMAIGTIGLASTIVSGVMVYGNNFLIAYPFFGYHIFLMAFHTILAVLGGFMTFRWQVKMEELGNVHKMSFGYVLGTIISGLGVFFIFYKVGGLLLSPIFIDTRNIYQTYCFLVSLLLLGLLYVHFVMDAYGFYKGKESSKIWVAVVLLLLSAVIYVQIAMTAWNNQAFTSAISLFNPIGRLLHFPYESIIQFAVAFGFGGFALGNAIHDYKRVHFKPVY